MAKKNKSKAFKVKGSSAQLALLSEPKEVVKHDPAPTFNLVITPGVWEKVMYWVRACPKEIGGMGKVVYDPATKAFTVTEAYLLHQEVTGSETELDDSSLATLMYETRNDPGHLKWWWHSHVNMDTFWSGTDRSTIDTFGKRGWFTATVFNKSGKYRSALAFKAEHTLFGNTTVTYDDVTTHVQEVHNPSHAAWEEEYKAKVKEKQYVYKYTNDAYDYYSQHQPEVNGAGSTALTRPTQYNHYDDKDWQEYREEFRKEGITGFGAASEARIFNKTFIEYFTLINECSAEEYGEIEAKLEQAIKEGKLR